MKPSDGYIAYVVNPRAGATSSKLTGWRFRGYLVGRGFEVRVSLTSSLEHARQLAAGAAADVRCRMVVVVGGDGTVREVVRGLAGVDKPMMIVPQGTENLLASELGYDERLKTLVRAFESGVVRPLDVGRANEQCFTSIVGFGFDGWVVKQVSERRSGNIDYYDYFWPTWRAFWEYRYSPMTVEVDGEQVFNGQGLVFVGNVSRYGMGLKILAHANYGDGLLDVCVYRCSSRLRLAKLSAMTVLKQHTKSRDVIYRQGRTMRISSPVNGIFSEIDGDPGPALPVTIEVIPNAVNVLVPPGAKPAGVRARIIRAIG
jgi:YegS/Rv2252/BmrU family lipid kinase